MPRSMRYSTNSAVPMITRLSARPIRVQPIHLEGWRAVIHKALDAGLTLFDTADIYGGRGGSETVMGQILGDRRKDIVLASKFGMPMDDGEKKGASRRYMMAAVEASLKR